MASNTFGSLDALCRKPTPTDQRALVDRLRTLDAFGRPTEANAAMREAARALAVEQRGDQGSSSAKAPTIPAVDGAEDAPSASGLAKAAPEMFAVLQEMFCGDAVQVAFAGNPLACERMEARVAAVIAKATSGGS